MNQASNVNGPAACASESHCRSCSSGSWDALTGTCSQTACPVQAQQVHDTVHDGGIGGTGGSAPKWYFIGDDAVNHCDLLCSEELEVHETFETEALASLSAVEADAETYESEVIATFLASLSAVEASSSYCDGDATFESDDEGWLPRYVPSAVAIAPPEPVSMARALSAPARLARSRMTDGAAQWPADQRPRPPEVCPEPEDSLKPQLALCEAKVQATRELLAVNSLSAALLPETLPLRHLHGESLLGDGAVGLGGDLLDVSVGVAPNVERVRGLSSNGAEHGEGETAAQESLPEHIDLPSLSFQSLDALESQRQADMLKAAEKIVDTDKVLGVSLGQVYTADTVSDDRGVSSCSSLWRGRKNTKKAKAAKAALSASTPAQATVTAEALVLQLAETRKLEAQAGGRRQEAGGPQAGGPQAGGRARDAGTLGRVFCSP